MLSHQMHYTPAPSGTNKHTHIHTYLNWIWHTIQTKVNKPLRRKKEPTAVISHSFTPKHLSPSHSLVNSTVDVESGTTMIRVSLCVCLYMYYICVCLCVCVFELSGAPWACGKFPCWHRGVWSSANISLFEWCSVCCCNYLDLGSFYS